MNFYKYPYYIGIAHGTYYGSPVERFYKTHLIVLCGDPFKIVYISDPLQFHPHLYNRFLGEKIWKVV